MNQNNTHWAAHEAAALQVQATMKSLQYAQQAAYGAQVALVAARAAQEVAANLDANIAAHEHAEFMKRLRRGR